LSARTGSTDGVGNGFASLRISEAGGKETADVRRYYVRFY